MPYMDSILDEVAGNEMYSFLDGFSGYNQIRMAPDDQAKTAFISAWGVFVCIVMWFGLRNAPSTFQRAMNEIFAPFLTDFMHIFLDDLSVFGSAAQHLQHLRLCFQCCKEVSFSINPLKSVFAVRSGKLLGHIISKEGIAVDPDKVAAIMQAPPPEDPKGCLRFLGQVRWHARHLRFLAHLAIPLNVVAHIEHNKYKWTEECNLAYHRKKMQLSRVPVMIPPDWGVDFHVFIDTSDVATIGNVLIQEQQAAGWFHPVYYASRRLSTAEKNYSVQRECLGMVYSVHKFRHYLLGQRFFFHVDHSALLYLVR